MLLIESPAQAQIWYDVVRKFFTVVAPLAGSITFFWDAPFGRFSRANETIFTVDGIKSWIIMELVSPATFLHAFLSSPLSLVHFDNLPPVSLSHPSCLLALLFLTHYLNRALISPLRTPSRSKSALAIPLAGALFNIANGSLLGAYLSSPGALAFLAGAYNRPRFWLGLGLWLAGFVGNIAHDEILLNIRRDKLQQQKDKATAGQDGQGGAAKEHYAVPHGLLYRYVSFPNYFCEWLEWFGFGLAAAPVPSFASGAALMASVAPPWIFLWAEMTTMYPRAWRGHRWYHRKFEDYPKERKVVVPFLL